MAGICIAADVFEVCDFDGPGSVSDFPSFTEALSESDCSFLDRCVLPVSPGWKGSQKLKRRKVDISCNNGSDSAIVGAVSSVSAIKGAISAIKGADFDVTAVVRGSELPWKGPIAETALLCRSISCPEESIACPEESIAFG